MTFLKFHVKIENYFHWKSQKLHGIGNVGFYFDFPQFLSLDWGFFFQSVQGMNGLDTRAFLIIAVWFFLFQIFSL